MKPEIKKKWINAARSGKYIQYRGALKKDCKVCILGLLCEIHSKETGKAWSPIAEEAPLHMQGCELYLGSICSLPDEVVTWAGLKDNNPTVNGYALSDHNDGRFSIDTSDKKHFAMQPKSFKELADIIEKHL